MPMLTKLKEFLDANGAAYEVRSHLQAFTAQEVAAAQHVPGREMAKVVIVRAGGEFLMAVLPAPQRVDLGQLGAAAGKLDLHLATEAEFAGLFPQCAAGAMPPFGNLYGLPVWVEEALTRDKDISFNAGTHEQTVRMAYADFAGWCGHGWPRSACTREPRDRRHGLRARPQIGDGTAASGAPCSAKPPARAWGSWRGKAQDSTRVRRATANAAVTSTWLLPG